VRASGAAFLATLALGCSDQAPTHCPAPDAQSLVTVVDGTFNGVETHVAAGAVVGERATVNACRRQESSERCGTVSFPISLESPPRLPPADAEVFVRAANCFGEGCDVTHWRVDDAFEIGTAATLDDDESTLRPANTRIVPADSRACIAPIVVRADDGDVALDDGEQRRVTIDGAAWLAIAGRGTREEFTQADDGCDDCPDVGEHSIARATAVLYRIDE
jgi:hypothetical protein